ncbi:aspartate/tyrosine/aromatic aminotransferase [Altererythrobacter sp. SALINAS58]|uniref:amino acid aminotransferase n=1 Tax=Alteripontixanthobacter muriae TaxID=2705546 RepID=UPI0015762A47|nr:aromatic amino acid transaminase [Alteripontixanthobacter muriae]NTZ41513.1 aspartate/tyrosine/aromatic aminotransferase [Alteripontixanthobacter muriae]
MLDRLDPQHADALLALIKMYADDPRPAKIDLGVGVYRTDDGSTPVFSAIKSAEGQLLTEQKSKAYLGPEGDMGFVHALMPYIFGENATMHGRIQGMQTPGGTGAVRLALALAKQAGVKRVLMGVPSWPNHAQILADVGLEVATFQHASADGSADLDALRSALDGAGAGDAVLLHGCCHNPTGIDYTHDQWDEIASMLVSTGVLPLIDVAYQGLGQGMEEDVYGLRAVLKAVPEALIAYSCDKNFGLYRDRVGAFYVMAQKGDQLDTIMSNANALARANWSMPPDHGGAAVRTVLRDAGMTDEWRAELASMRDRMRDVRAKLAGAGNAGSLDLTSLGKGNGLFAVLPLDKQQIAALRRDHGVYMAGSGRINVAGLHSGNIDTFIAALSEVAN